MPCAHRIPLTACRWPHHARRPAARSGGPTVAHITSPTLLQLGKKMMLHLLPPAQQSAARHARPAVHHAIAHLIGTLRRPQTTRIHDPREQCIAVPEHGKHVASPSMPSSNDSFSQQDCACRSCWLRQKHCAEGAGGLPGV